MQLAGMSPPKTLITVWLALMAAALATMVAGRVTETASPGLVYLGVLMMITWLKAVLVLRYFLDLKAAEKGWFGGFSILTGGILLVVWGVYAAGFAAASH